MLLFGVLVGLLSCWLLVIGFNVFYGCLVFVYVWVWLLLRRGWLSGGLVRVAFGLLASWFLLLVFADVCV